MCSYSVYLRSYLLLYLDSVPTSGRPPMIPLPFDIISSINGKKEEWCLVDKGEHFTIVRDNVVIRYYGNKRMFTVFQDDKQVPITAHEHDVLEDEMNMWTVWHSSLGKL